MTEISNNPIQLVASTIARTAPPADESKSFETYIVVAETKRTAPARVEERANSLSNYMQQLEQISAGQQF